MIIFCVDSERPTDAGVKVSGHAGVVVAGLVVAEGHRVDGEHGCVTAVGEVVDSRVECYPAGRAEVKVPRGFYPREQVGIVHQAVGIVDKLFSHLLHLQF